MVFEAEARAHVLSKSMYGLRSKKWQWNSLLRDFGFPLLVLFHERSILVFIYMLFSVEGQTYESREPA